MRLRVIAVLMVLGVIAAACGNSRIRATATTTAGGGTVAVDQPGVTDTEIRVGGIASVTNPLGTDYGAAFDGVKAYFEMVNSEGGIYGRDLELVTSATTSSGTNKAEVQGLLAQDNVFAALPIAALLFPGADVLAEAKIPTFGWNINEEWTGPENFFQQGRPLLRLRGPRPPLAGQGAGQEEGRRPGLQRPAVGRLRQGHRGVVREVPRRPRSSTDTSSCRSASPTSAPRSRR